MGHLGASPPPPHRLICHILYVGVFTGGGGGGGHFWGFDAKWEVFLPLSYFRPEVGMDFAQKLVPPYFGHGEFKNQGVVAQQNGDGAI